jgi:inner membrane protein
MMGRSHLLIGVVAALGVASATTSDATALFTVASAAAVGSIAPDWDLYLPIIKHRTLTHNVLIPVLIWWLLPGWLGMGLALGWLLHIAADCLTVSGVPVLWPLPFTLRGPVTTGTWGEGVALFFIFLGGFWLWSRNPTFTSPWLFIHF